MPEVSRADSVEGRKPKKAKAEGQGAGPASPPRKRAPGGPPKAAPKGRARPSPEAKAPPAEAQAEGPAAPVGPPRLLRRYREEVRPTLMRETGYRNIMEVPRLEKIVLNIGLGEATQNPKAVEAASGHLATITGQRPVVTRARKSVAAFKLREGMSIGAMVTLRSARMYDFFDRLVNMALPRIRDFRGTPRQSFDGRGNYSLGIREQAIFPEIDYGQIDRVRGLQVTFVTTARTDREAQRLLELLGMPFARDGETPTR